MDGRAWGQAKPTMTRTRVDPCRPCVADCYPTALALCVALFAIPLTSRRPFPSPR